MNSFEVLAFVERYADSFVVQQLAPAARQKNRVILTCRTPDGLSTVGARSLVEAVHRAKIRMEALQADSSAKGGGAQ
jgi:hypothetical protein